MATDNVSKSSKRALSRLAGKSSHAEFHAFGNRALSMFSARQCPRSSAASLWAALVVGSAQIGGRELGLGADGIAHVFTLQDSNKLAQAAAFSRHYLFVH